MSKTDDTITTFLKEYYAKSDGVEKVEIVVLHSIYKETTGTNVTVFINDRDAFEAQKLKEKMVHNQIMEEAIKEALNLSSLAFEYKFVFK